MSRTVREALIGLLYLVIVAALVGLSVLFYNHAFTSYVSVTLRTATAGNALQAGSDVKVRGVLVGQVSSISSDGDGVIVHLHIDPSQAKQLPDNVTGAVLPKTLFGEQYVDLSMPADASAHHLHSGDRITPDDSPATIEIQRLFNDLLPVLQAVRPDELSATLGELASALSGSVPDDFASLIHTLGGYLHALAPHVPQLATDLDRLAAVAHIYTGAGPKIVSALDSLTTTSQTLVSQRADFESSISTLTTLAHSVGGFVGTTQNQIIGVSVNSQPALQVLAQYSSEFPCLARALVAYLPKVDQAFGVGTKQPGLHIVLHVVPRVGPYTSAQTSYPVATTQPRCPYTPATALSATALANIPGIQGAQNAATGTASSTKGSADSKRRSSATSSPAVASADAGMGTANSPQENHLIAELVASSMGVSPSSVPDWASLLLGPALRGSQVNIG